MSAEASPRVRVIGMRIVTRAQNGNSLSGHVAFFDAVVPFFTLFGAELHRRRNGTLVVAAPRGQHGDGLSCGMRFDDQDLRAEILEAACTAARALGANVDAWPAEED